MKEAVLIRDINECRFDPDCTVADMIQKELDSLLEEDVLARADESDDEGHWKEVIDARDISDEADELIPGEPDAELLDPMATYYQHNSSGTLHILKDATRFACGRAVGVNYIKVEGVDRVHWHVCSQCSTVVYGSV